MATWSNTRPRLPPDRLCPKEPSCPAIGLDPRTGGLVPGSTIMYGARAPDRIDMRARPPELAYVRTRQHCAPASSRARRPSVFHGSETIGSTYDHSPREGPWDSPSRGSRAVSRGLGEPLGWSRLFSEFMGRTGLEPASGGLKVRLDELKRTARSRNVLQLTRIEAATSCSELRRLETILYARSYARCVSREATAACRGGVAR
jgi:hypothetical protein